MAYTTIDDPEAYFQAKLYTGNGGSQSITLDGDTDMQPDMVWIKERDVAHSSSIIDSVRGVRKTLTSDESAAEITESAGLSAFDSDGLTFDGAGGNHVNDSSQPTVAWCWKESATAGFDIVSYTGNGSNRTISHSLSAVPNIVLVKNRSTSSEWQMFHTSLGNTKYMQLQGTQAAETNSNRWQDTTPTSSVFSIGTHDNVNKNTDGIIAYCFAEKQGFSKFASYEGNGNADGTFVYLGFRPAYILVKNIDATNDWRIHDNKREGYNETNDGLKANTTVVEFASACDFVSNGFKIRNTDGDLNTSGSTYIYMAFAEAPFVNSKGVPCNAR